MTKHCVTVRFCGANDFISKIIRMGTYHFPYSHCEIVLPDGTAIGAHARTGVAIEPKGAHGKHEIARRSVALPCTAAQAESLASYLSDQLGKPYDFAAISAIALSFVRDHNDRERQWRADNKWFCSELVAAALEQAGIISFVVEEASRLTPRDLMIALSTHPEAVWSEIEKV